MSPFEKTSFILLILILFSVLSLFTRVEAMRIARDESEGRSGLPVKLTLWCYIRALGIVLGHTVLAFLILPLAIGHWVGEKVKKE